MNKERRKALDGAIEEINKAKSLLLAMDYSEITDLLESAKSAIDEARDEEQESFDNLSEGLQQSERGQRMEEICNDLEEACSDLEEIVGSIEEQDLTGGFDEIIGKIEGAKD